MKNLTLFFKKMLLLFESARPFNLVMVAAGVIITIFIGLANFGPKNLTIPAVVAAVLIAGGGNSLNDYYDVETDRVNRPKRPLPSGRLNLKDVQIFSFALFGTGIIVSFMLPHLNIALAVINSVLLVLYASKLKRSGFFGNILISYLVASVFIFGAAAINKLLIGIFLAIVAFFTNASREVLKDLEDVKGDKFLGAQTFPILEGKKKSIAVIKSFLLMAIIISPIPYLIGFLSLYYLFFAIIADILFTYTIVSLSRNNSLKEISRQQKIIKIAAVIGLFAFLAGTVAFLVSTFY